MSFFKVFVKIYIYALLAVFGMLAPRSQGVGVAATSSGALFDRETDSCTSLLLRSAFSRLDVLRERFVCLGHCHFSAGEVGRFLVVDQPVFAPEEASIVFLKQRGYSFGQALEDPSVNPFVDKNIFLYPRSDTGFKRWTWHAFLKYRGYALDLYPQKSTAIFTIQAYVNTVFPEVDDSENQGVLSKTFLGKRILNARKTLQYAEMPLSTYLQAFPESLDLNSSELSLAERQMTGLMEKLRFQSVESLVNIQDRSL